MKTKVIFIGFFLFFAIPSFASAANKFWVGGTGNWDATAGNKWATTSGGSTTSSIPTSADNCFFDANSTGTVTVTATSACGSLDFTGFTRTFAGSSVLTIPGNITLAATMTMTHTGTITMNSTSSTSTSTITSNGIQFSQAITINTSGTVQLADSLSATSTRTITLTAGTFDANNKNVTTGIFSSTNSNTRTLLMGTGTWTITGDTSTIWNTNTATNFTFNSGSSTVVINGGSSGSKRFISGNGIALNDLYWTDTGTAGLSLETNGSIYRDIYVQNTGGGALSIAGSFSARNVDFTGSTSGLSNSLTLTIMGNLKIASNTAVTYTGTLTFATSSAVTHQLTTNGVQWPSAITINTSGTLQLLDNLNVSSTKTITLTAGTFDFNNRDVSTGLFSSSNSNIRALSTGTGVLTLTGAGTVWTTSTGTNLTLTMGSSSVQVVNNSTSTKTITIGAASPAPSGFLIASSTLGTVTLSGSGSFGTISAPGSSATFTNSAGPTVNNLDFTGFLGTWSGSSAFSIGGSLTLATSTIQTNTATITFTATSGINMITTNGVALDNGLTFNSASGTWKLADDFVNGVTRTITLTAGTLDANNHNLTTGLFVSSNSNPRTITLGSGTWNLTGTSGHIWNVANANGLTLNAGSSTITVTGDTSGFKTFDTGGVSLIYNDIVFSGSGSGQLSFSGPGGAVRAVVHSLRAPNTASTQVYFNTGFDIQTVDFTGFTGALAFFNDVNVSGDFTLSSGMTYMTWISGSLTFNATSGVHTVTTGGIPVLNAMPIIFDGIGGAWQLANDLAMSSGTLTLTNGTLNANNRNVATGLFSSSNSNTRTLTMGSGTWTITGSGSAWDMATSTGAVLSAGSSLIKFTTASTTDTTFAGGGLTYGNLWDATSDTGTLTITGSNTFNDFKIDAGRTVKFTDGTTQTFSTFTARGDSVNPITLASTGGTPHSLVKSGGGIIQGDYLTISNSAASPADTWYAGALGQSIDGGGNTGWLFSVAGSGNAGVSVGNPAPPPVTGGGWSTSFTPPYTPPSQPPQQPQVPTSTSPAVIPEIYDSPDAFAPSGCIPYLTKYIKRGAINDADAVRKLQQFLNGELALNLSVTGTYDEPTYQAVIRLQEKYPEKILAPWGLTKGTGYVYLSTARQVNVLNCVQAGSLNADATLPALLIGVPTANDSQFYRTLKAGSTGEDVRALQRYLNSHGFIITPTGSGSPGHETTTFGLLTARALIKFQEAHVAEILAPNNLTKGTGIFGNSTRGFVNKNP